MRMMRLGGLSLLFCVLFSFSAQASATHTDPGAFVKALGDRAIELLTSGQISEEEQAKRFRTLLREGFAVNKIGQFVLGKYRRKATSEELHEFLQLYEDYIVSLYSSAFRNYSGQTFAVSRVVQTKNRHDTMVVTHINPETDPNPTKVIFQVRNWENVYKVLDIKIQGVSMILTQRDEFTGLISNNGGNVSALIDALRKKTKALQIRVK
jgi:phospholipid transport system substrate-binding protein|tara:strand:+ start:1352 stop:1978 length:627 start_codon:yes stop_codon:yes gene_type:complete